ncbi:MAG: hypothetical protein AB2693_21180, partial [Candidatus Thiodiazotropha sp.]
MRMLNNGLYEEGKLGTHLRNYLGKLKKRVFEIFRCVCYGFNMFYLKLLQKYGFHTLLAGMFQRTKPCINKLVLVPIMTRL